MIGSRNNAGIAQRLVRYIANVDMGFRLPLPAPMVERFRPALRDRRGDITPAARKIHDLILSDTLVKNDADPDVSFAMSGIQRAMHVVQRDILLVDLKVAKRPVDREKRLDTMKQALVDEGIPHWLKLPEES